MRNLIVVLIALSATFSAVKLANACGDKTMRVGRGLRFHQVQAAKYPSSILIHASALPEGNASRLRDFLKAVGHKAQTFDDVEGLRNDLKTGQYALLLTNPAAGPNFDRPASSLSPKTVVVAVTFKSEETVATTQYTVIVKN